MIKLAYNKDNTNLVFEINKIDRVAVGNAGIKEDYVGTLKDYSTNPATETNNYRVQVVGFESDWSEVPVDVASGGGSTINNQDKTITSNGEYTADAGYTGLGTVNVTVEPALETIDYSVTGNNTYTIIKTDPTKDGIGQVNLTVDVPQTVTPVDLDLTTGVKFAYSNFQTVPQEIVDANWDDITDGTFMFAHCNALGTIPNIDTSNLVIVTSMFDGAFNISEIPYVLNFQNVEYFNEVFRGFQAIDYVESDIPFQNILGMLATINLQNLNPKSIKPYLRVAGLNGAQIERCTGLAQWATLEAAGWSTGLELTVNEDLSTFESALVINTPVTYDSITPNAYVCFTSSDLNDYNTTYTLTLTDNNLGKTRVFTKNDSQGKYYFTSESGAVVIENIYNAWNETDENYYAELTINKKPIYVSCDNVVYDSTADETTIDVTIGNMENSAIYINTVTITDNNDPTAYVEIPVGGWYDSNTQYFTTTITMSGDHAGAYFVNDYDDTISSQI